jgi:hypothetical protein
MLAGDIPTAYGVSPWISIALGTVIMVAVLFIVGKNVDRQD